MKQAWGLAGLGVWAWTACAAERPQPAAFAHISDKRVDEPSAFVRSVRNPGLYWTVNDSGGKAAVYAVDLRGYVRASVKVRGADNVDWEALAVRGDELLIADLGDNNNRRSDLKIYVVPEPAHTDDEVRVTREIAVRYPDRPAYGGRRWDSEALFTVDGAIFLLTKHRDDFQTRLFRVPEEGGDLLLIGGAPVGGEDHRYGGMVTDAALSPNGRRLGVLTYHALLEFERSGDRYDWLEQPVRAVPLDPDVVQQCESLAWHDGAWIIGNEQGDLFRLPPGFAGTFPAR